MMRRPRSSDLAAWRRRLGQYGYLNDAGSFVIERWALEGVEVVEDAADQGVITVRTITPLPAPLYSEATLEKKPPPVMFDRTPDGRLILPGRLVHSALEALESAAAAAFARTMVLDDALLDPATDTIELLVTDRDGSLVPHEALPPDITFTVRYRRGSPPR